MFKQTSVRRVMSRNTPDTRVSRVFFAVLARCYRFVHSARTNRANPVSATPVIFYTRTRVRIVSAFAVVALTAVTASSLLITPAAAASANTTVNFQARLQSAAGTVAPNGNYNLEFKLYDAATGSTSLWTEDYLNSGSHGVHVVDGYLTVSLGSINAFPNSIPWDHTLYVTMNVGGSGDDAKWDGEMNPRLQLTAVPYAFLAKSATQLHVSNSAGSSTLAFKDPTQNNTILLPDESGTVCLVTSASCGFAAANGSSSYIQNGTTLQTGANLNIQSNSKTATTLTLRALAGQTADLIQFVGSDGSTLGGITANGDLYHQTAGGTGTLVQDGLRQNTVYHLPDPGTASAEICLSSGNCAGLASSSTNLQADAIDSVTPGVLTLGKTNASGVVLDLSGNSVLSFTSNGLLHSFNVGTAKGAQASGDGLAIAAGAANPAGQGGNGGDLSLSGGAATGNGNNGGSVLISGGAASAAGKIGAVSLQASGGNVGIGTTTPDAALEVNAGIEGQSGIKLTQLSSASSAAASNGKVLSVDEKGNVILVAAQAGVISLGSLDGGAASVNGASLSAGTLYLQSASATSPGIVNNSAQTFSGDKTFAGSIYASLAYGANYANAVCLTGQTAAKQLVACGRSATANYAEDYPVSSDVAFGDVVVTGSQLINTYGTTDGMVDWNLPSGQVSQLIKSHDAYQASAIGVVTDNMGSLTSAGANIRSSDNPKPVALNGRVLVNVAADSAAIHAGDYLTTSGTVMGKAAKATTAGYVIGKALADWVPNSGQTQVMLYVQPGFYAGENALSLVQNGGSAGLADLQVTGTATFADINASGMATLNDLKVQTLELSGALTVQGLVTVTDIQINGHVVTGGTTPVASAIANAGTGAQCTVTGNDTSGQIAITTGSNGWQSGAQCSITFAKAFAAAPHPVLTPAYAAGAATNTTTIQPFVDASPTGFNLSFSSADTANHTYVFNYFNAQ